MQVVKHFIWRGKLSGGVEINHIHSGMYEVTYTKSSLIMERVAEPQVSKKQVALPLLKEVSE